MRGLIPAERSLEIEIGGLYWHFVDIVWIIIFTVVYLVPI
jgi:cytochrome c oxidase subunit 3/cytochrome o ubiquinol oxidase subunit 3